MIPEAIKSRSVRVDTDTCWEWTGHVAGHGYGYVYYDRRSRRAHRVAYEAAHGLIPDGLTIDHLCRNRTCVNPAHLEAVTMAENRRRGKCGIMKIYCDHGHRYIDQNLQYRPDGSRYCKVCDKARRDARDNK